MTNVTAIRRAPAERGTVQPVIAVDDLIKVYETRDGTNVHALGPITFDVKPGEFIAVVGASGCGKSTLLKMLAGLVTTTSGTLTLNGRAVEGPQREIGVVFQDAVLLPWRTVLDNVMLPAEVLGLNKRESRERALDLLAMVGLQDFQAKYPQELSGGMQQRVSIARALLHEPKLLLMDEPFGALDAMTRETMSVEVLRIWAQSGKTIIFVTHSISEAVFLADRVLVMTSRPGRIARIVDIDLPRPRELDMINSDQFGVYARTIRGLLSTGEKQR